MSPRAGCWPRALAAVAGNLALATALAAALSGCRGLTRPEGLSATSSATSSVASSVEATSNPQAVTREELGGLWPFEFDSCELSAETNASGDPVLRLTTIDGAVYALNDLPENDGLPKAEDLVRPGASIGPIRSLALSISGLG